MLIHKTRPELQTLMYTLQRLPAEGSNLQEVVDREHARWVLLQRMAACVGAPPPAPYSDTPTVMGDEYWCLRLGVVRG